MNYSDSTLNYKGGDFGPKLNLVPVTINDTLVSTTKDTDTSKEDLTSQVDKAVVIIFEYKNHFTNAKPILDKYGFKASFFIICSFVNGHGYYNCQMEVN
jgi:peptidoglycan/xylan/chitin deacetylase (PgdA/CDA1 family)